MREVFWGAENQDTYQNFAGGEGAIEEDLDQLRWLFPQNTSTLLMGSSLLWDFPDCTNSLYFEIVKQQRVRFSWTSSLCSYSLRGYITALRYIRSTRKHNELVRRYLVFFSGPFSFDLKPRSLPSSKMLRMKVATSKPSWKGNLIVKLYKRARHS